MIQLSSPMRGHAAILHRAQVEGAELADGVAVADLQTGRLAGVFLVLRHFAQRTELEDAVIAADTGMAPDHAMRTDDRVVPDLDVRTDDRIGADSTPLAILPRAPGSTRAVV